MRISLRTFCIVLLVLASLWLLAILGPPVYCWFVPPKDFDAVVRALQNRGSPPAPAVSAVQQTVASAGALRHAVQIGYYYRAQVTFRAAQKHLEKEAQASYVASFEKLPRPILLIVQKQQIDNEAEDYQIAEGDPFGLVRGLVLPCAIFAGTIFALRWSSRKRPRRLGKQQST